MIGRRAPSRKVLEEVRGVVVIIVLGTSGLWATIRYLRKVLAPLAKALVVVVAGDKEDVLRAGFHNITLIEVSRRPAGLDRDFGWACIRPYLAKILEVRRKVQLKFKSVMVC